MIQKPTESGQARSAVTISTRPADPKYWALPPRKEKRKRQKKWVLVGSTAASLLLLLTGYSNNNQGAPNYSNQAQANPVVTESDLQGLTDAERTILMTASPGTRAAGTLYILESDKFDEKKLVIAIRGLKPSSDHVYQVWKHYGDRVEAVGTIEPSEDGKAMFASRLSDYRSIEGITITKEKRYEKHPMGRDLLIAALSPTWEKNSFHNGQHKAVKKKSESVSRQGKAYASPTRVSRMSDGKESQYTYSHGSNTLKKSRISSTKQYSSQKPSGSKQQQKPPTTQPKNNFSPNDGGSQSSPSNTGSNTNRGSSDKNLLDVDLNLGGINIGIKL
jgi:hypothetical protein